MTEPVVKKKLIEVALPLQAINEQSAREKSIRHGHPSTLHLWWARRPLAACRAVLFAQLVDDPSSRPDDFPTEAEQNAERQRLFRLIERMVDWDNANDEELFRQAHAEIARCYDGRPPAILDPFAGGGSIPLEAQRLGLGAHGSDLNPVAVLINKALIEIPPAFADLPPVWPGAAEERQSDASSWYGARGLAEDVRRYGAWMREEAERRIGHLYAKATLPDGSKANVVAWIWARTVTCPNPACGIAMPLMRSFCLSKKKGHEKWVRPRLNGADVEFEIYDGPGPEIDGTVGRLGARCVACATSVPLKDVRTAGKAVGLGVVGIAKVADGGRGRIYLPADPFPTLAPPPEIPDQDLPSNPRDFKTPNYGLTTFAELFTTRQLVALTTYSDLVGEARQRVVADADVNCDRNVDAYADAVATYLALGVSRLTDIQNSLCHWENTKTQVRHLFGRQAIPMIWDFAEPGLFSSAAGDYSVSLESLCRAIDRLPASVKGDALQRNATDTDFAGFVVSTDPPYYDNIGYADLSDFFYVWLRRSLRSIYPDLFATVLTPKTQELVAAPHRFDGDKESAERHFEDGFVETFANVAVASDGSTPTTIFYAYKQAESTNEETASTGWETMLEGLISARLEITATWPMRTELTNRMIGSGTNALASSIVLACRRRQANASATTRRGFIAALRDELPHALRRLETESTIAPVDLPQAAIGPGMAVFSRYTRVSEADGTDMSVRTALALINQALDDVLAEQEGDLDTDSRFCVKWFEQYGFDSGPYGDAETMSRAVNTSVDGLARAGVLRTGSGKVALLAPAELHDGYSPAADDRVSAWEVVMHLARALESFGTSEAGRILAEAGTRIDKSAAKELAFRLHQICSKNGWTESAITFNGLGTSWIDIEATARVDSSGSSSPTAQTSLFNHTVGDDDGTE